MRLIDADSLRKKVNVSNDDILFLCCNQLSGNPEAVKRAAYSMMNARDGFLMDIDEEPTADQWIPCSEELPDKNKPVIVCDTQGRICVRCFLEKSSWSKGKMDVVAWMPFPEPYKGGRR